MILDKKTLDFIRDFLELEDTKWIHIEAQGERGKREIVLPVGGDLPTEVVVG